MTPPLDDSQLLSAEDSKILSAAAVILRRVSPDIPEGAIRMSASQIAAFVVAIHKVMLTMPDDEQNEYKSRSTDA